MIGLVHLVWAPLGSQPLRRFLDSYREHPSGVEHELVVLLNGVGAPGAASREALLAELEDTEHRLLELPRPMFDLDAYTEAARLLDHETLCFVNSYALVLAAGWLGALTAAVSHPDVGLAGASGSWESQAEWMRGSLRHWPQQLIAHRHDRRDYPGFPNPHVRTSTFALRRSVLVDMGLERSAGKRHTYLLESGHASITRKIQKLGLRAVVVGCDGALYDPPRWPQSNTFRIGVQENLLVADNQTLDYEKAGRRRRRRLTRDSWGEPAGAAAGEVAAGEYPSGDSQESS